MNWTPTGNRVKVVQGGGDAKYGDQDTDGSHSVRSFFDTLRESGASGRLMLVRAAAQKWGVPEKECTTEPGMVVHKASGKKLSYGELASAAAKLPVPKKEELQLKGRSDWRYIGKPNKAYDLKNMVSGQAMLWPGRAVGRDALRLGDASARLWKFAPKCG